jgi:predicted metal-dependent peptidase
MIDNSSQSLQERIQSIRNKWFLIDPGFFIVICTHKIEFNSGIGCSIACGNGYIYINPQEFEKKSDTFLEDALKLECVRILLKHPYQRQLPNRVKNYLASNMVIADNYSFGEMKIMTSSEFFGSYRFKHENMEMIYDNIILPETPNSKDKKRGAKTGASNDQSTHSQSNSPSTNDNQKKSKDINNLDDACSSEEDAYNRSQFWKEDDLKVVEINKIIEKISNTSSWGSMPGDIVDVIKKSITSKFNYKAIFQQFRSTVLSSSRNLTRMKPNRRFGYDAMGSKRNFTTKILVAVDTSGSISQEELSIVFDFINNFFKYGIDEIDTIQFDCDIKKESLKKLSKKMNVYEIHGRGGTDFNCVFKYVQEDKNYYDGVIIVTDGCASVPDKKWLKTNYRNTRYLWCLNNENRLKSFSKNKDFQEFGKCTYVDKLNTNISK